MLTGRHAGRASEKFPGRHRLQQRAKTKILPTSRCRPGEADGRNGRLRAMYTGTLIEELIAAVERAEEHARQSAQAQSLESWYATAHSHAEVQPDLLGVA